jgi:cytoskeletal protein CcmA (bactofilin family)
MFSRSQAAPKPAPRNGKSGPPGLSFFGDEVVVSGDVTTSAQLHVDGRIEGDVRCGQLCQGASGTIAGNIVADEARIAGLVEGTVNARTLVIETSGRVTGDVTYETITIAAGAQVDGRLARRAALGGAEQPTMLVASPIPTSDEAADGLFPVAGAKRAASG